MGDFRPAPDPPRFLTDHLRVRANRNPRGAALVLLTPDGGAERVSNGRLLAEAEGYAAALAQDGAVPGGPTLLVIPHSVDLLAAFWGAMLAGTAPVILPYMAPHTRLDAYIDRVAEGVRRLGAAHLITTDRWREPLAARLSETGCRIVVERSPVRDAAAAPLPDSTGLDSPAYIQLSSGTTGVPRGAVLSRRAVMAQVAGIIEALDIGPPDVLVSWLPPFHDMGLVSLLTAAAADLVAVLMSPFHWVRSPADYLRAIHEYGGSISWMPNFGFAHCVRAVREADLAGVDLSGWRILGNGAEPIRRATLTAFADRFVPHGFKPAAIRTGYGMAEHVLAVTLSRPAPFPPIDRVRRDDLNRAGRATPAAAHSDGAVRLVSSGRPIGDTRVRIIDTAGETLPDRRVGEIIVRGDSLLDGYLQEAGTVHPAVKSTGWFHTGDMGYIADGELYVRGRRTDMIIVGGRNVFPEDIEGAVRSATGGRIRRVAAFGVESAEAGTEIPVVVCETPGGQTGAARRHLIRDIRERVYEALDVILGDVLLVGRGWIEKTTSGKIPRRRCRDKYLEMARTPELFPISPDDCSADELKGHLVRYFESVLGIHPIHPADPLFELGVDSLQFFHLFTRIEEGLGIRLPLAELLREPTIDHLVRMIQRPAESGGGGEGDADSFSRDLDHSIAGPRAWRVISRPDLTPARKLHQLGTMAAVRMVRSGPFVGRMTPSYETGMEWIRWMAADGSARRRLFRRPVRRLRQLLTEMAAEGPAPSPHDLASVIFRSLTSNFWNAWRISALRRLHPRRLDRWVHVAGAETIHQARRAGCGVILVHGHFPLLRVIGPVLNRLGVDEAAVVGMAAYVSDHFMTDRSASRMPGGAVSSRGVLIGQLYLGKQTLERGGIVHIVPDAYGETGVPVPFFGRRRRFMTGFAELAVQTRAAVLPVSVKGDPSGRVRVEFHDPLHAGGFGHRPASSRIASLVRQYARFLAEAWHRDPGNISWRQVERFFELPVIDPVEKFRF